MQEIGLVSRRKLRRMRPLIASNVMFNSMWETREYILQHVYIYMAILGCFNAVSTTIFSPEKQSNLIIVTGRSKGLALKLFRLLLGYSRTIFFFFNFINFFFEGEKREMHQTNLAKSFCKTVVTYGETFSIHTKKSRISITYLTRLRAKLLHSFLV